MNHNEDLLRPQPIGLTPWPHGGLLLPDHSGVAEYARATVVAGSTPDEVPESLAFWVAAGRDDLRAARAALAGEDLPVTEYNRFVLDPDISTLLRLRSRFTGFLAEWLEVAAYQLGLRPDPPQVQALDGEFAAVAHAGRATAAIEGGDIEAAVAELEAGIEAAWGASPGLSAQLLLSLEELERMRGGSGEASIERLRKALAGMPEEGFRVLRAEVQLELGGVLQETSDQDRRRLLEAVAMFQDCLCGLDPQVHPRAHGFAQMRLGLAYLALPMRDAGDALRMGVATQALREAVALLSAEREPELWCSAASNLANAYQVLPSGHLADNLELAIELYNQVLALRPAGADPLGHGRTLINRANAQATLERRAEALHDLERALALLQPHVQAAELETVRSQADDLRQTLEAAAEGAGR